MLWLQLRRSLGDSLKNEVPVSVLECSNYNSDMVVDRFWVGLFVCF